MKYNKDNLVHLCSKLRNYSEILRHLNLNVSSGNYRTLKKYIKEYNIEFVPQKRDYSLSKKIYSDEECFKENSKISRHHLKSRIIKNKLIEYKCNECNNVGIWNNKPLVLQLDHINGINDDNRLVNLRFICPNCHTQTNTYSARNKKTGN